MADPASTPAAIQQIVGAAATVAKAEPAWCRDASRSQFAGHVVGRDPSGFWFVMEIEELLRFWVGQNVRRN